MTIIFRKIPAAEAIKAISIKEVKAQTQEQESHSRAMESPMKNWPNMQVWMTAGLLSMGVFMM